MIKHSTLLLFQKDILLPMFVYQSLRNSYLILKLVADYT
ncbi:hypothetical protein CCP3SC1AL1_100001 [Gammaproteobacteria bacterium]